MCDLGRGLQLLTRDTAVYCRLILAKAVCCYIVQQQDIVGRPECTEGDGCLWLISDLAAWPGFVWAGGIAGAVCHTCNNMATLLGYFS